MAFSVVSRKLFSLFPDGGRVSFRGEVYPADQPGWCVLRSGSLRVHHPHHCARSHSIQGGKSAGKTVHYVCIHPASEISPSSPFFSLSPSSSLPLSPYPLPLSSLSLPSFLPLPPLFPPSCSQLLDLPGIIEGAKDGKGRGRQVIAVARTCSLIFIVLDVLKPLQHKKLIEHELEGFGIRLNKTPPNIGFRKKDKGGLNLTLQVKEYFHTHQSPIPTTFPPSPSSPLSQVSQSHLDLTQVRSILAEYRIHNADVTLRCDATADDLIDVVEGNRSVCGE